MPTGRIALKKAGLEAASVTGDQLAAHLGEIPATPNIQDTPEAVFARLGR